jgi:hypothetical protein
VDRARDKIYSDKQDTVRYERIVFGPFSLAQNGVSVGPVVLKGRECGLSVGPSRIRVRCIVPFVVTGNDEYWSA